MYNHSHVFNFGFTIVSELLKKINLINSDIKTSTYYCSMIKRLFFSKNLLFNDKETHAWSLSKGLIEIVFMNSFIPSPVRSWRLNEKWPKKKERNSNAKEVGIRYGREIGGGFWDQKVQVG